MPPDGEPPNTPQSLGQGIRAYQTIIVAVIAWLIIIGITVGSFFMVRSEVTRIRIVVERQEKALSEFGVNLKQTMSIVQNLQNDVETIKTNTTKHSTMIDQVAKNTDRFSNELNSIRSTVHENKNLLSRLDERTKSQ